MEKSTTVHRFKPLLKCLLFRNNVPANYPVISRLRSDALRDLWLADPEFFHAIIGEQEAYTVNDAILWRSELLNRCLDWKTIENHAGNRSVIMDESISQKISGSLGNNGNDEKLLNLYRKSTILPTAIVFLYRDPYGVADNIARRHHVAGVLHECHKGLSREELADYCNNSMVKHERMNAFLEASGVAVHRINLDEPEFHA